MGNTYDPKPPDQTNAGPDLVKAGNPGGQSTAKTTGQLSPHPDAVPMPSGPVQMQGKSDPSYLDDLHLDLTGQGDGSIGALEHQRCAGDAPSPECRLSAEDRGGVRREFGSRVDRVAADWRICLLRLELTAASRISGLAGAIVDVAMGAMVLASGATGAGALAVRAVTGQVGAALKGLIASAPESMPTELRAMPGLWAERLRNELPPVLTDDDLIAATLALSATVMTTAVVQGIVDDLVKRYGEQVAPVDGDETRPARIMHRYRDGSGRYIDRLALVKWHPWTKVVGEGIAARVVSTGIGQRLDGATFVRWIDDDMGDSAKARDAGAERTPGSLWLDTYAGGGDEQIDEHPELAAWMTAVEAKP